MTHRTISTSIIVALMALLVLVILLRFFMRKQVQFNPEDSSNVKIGHKSAIIDDNRGNSPKVDGTASSVTRSPLYEELATDRLSRENPQAYDYLLNDFETDGALAQVSLSVIDEDEKPVPEASVKMSFTIPGGEGEYKSNTGLTDNEGLFVSEGITCWNVVWRVEKQDYHACWSNLVLRPYMSVQGRREGKWFRAPFPVTAVLRKKISPHKMRVYDGDISLPLSGDTIGFDLVDGKPTPPHGEGRHCDVEFSAIHNPNEWKRGNKADRVSIVKIAFQGGGNGGIIVKKDEFCDLDTPRDAPDDGYETSLESTTTFIGGKYSETGRIQPNQYIIFKIRGENGGDGNGYYGKIQGDWHVNGPRRELWFRVWINDEPGNRNLEINSVKMQLPAKNR